MKTVLIVVGVGVGLALGLVLARSAVAPFTSRGGGGAYRAHDRENVIVLIPNGSGGCRALKAPTVRALQRDRVLWTVYDACNQGNAVVGLNFPQGNPDDGSGSLLLSDTFNNGVARLRLKVKDLSGVQRDPVCDCWKYSYTVYLGNTATVLTDPDLEIDPYSS